MDASWADQPSVFVLHFSASDSASRFALWTNSTGAGPTTISFVPPARTATRNPRSGGGGRCWEQLDMNGKPEAEPTCADAAGRVIVAISDAPVYLK